MCLERDEDTFWLTPILDFDDRQFARKGGAFAKFLNKVHDLRRGTDIEGYLLSVQQRIQGTIFLFSCGNFLNMLNLGSALLYR